MKENITHVYVEVIDDDQFDGHKPCETTIDFVAQHKGYTPIISEESIIRGEIALCSTVSFYKREKSSSNKTRKHLNIVVLDD